MAEKEIRLIHIDTSLYAPAATIPTLCRLYMDETIIVFDEFYNWLGLKNHEFKAFSEFMAQTPGEFDVRYVGSSGHAAVSALVRRTRGDGP